LRLEGHIAAGQPRFHLQHFFALDVPLPRHHVHFTLVSVLRWVSTSEASSFMVCFIEAD